MKSKSDLHEGVYWRDAILCAGYPQGVPRALNFVKKKWARAAGRLRHWLTNEVIVFSSH